MQSSERNEVIQLQLEGASAVTEGEDHEPMTSPLIDPTVGFILLSLEEAS